MAKIQKTNQPKPDDSIQVKRPDVNTPSAQPFFSGSLSKELLKLKSAIQLQSLNKKIKQRGKFEKSYLYTDENGQPLFEVFRYESKERLLKKLNGESLSPDDESLVLYNLPGIKRNAAIFATNEKNADALIALGVPATTNPGGILPNWVEAFHSALIKKDVYILPNNTHRDRKHARWVAEHLLGKTKRDVKVINLPEAEAGEEIYQWIEKQKASGKTNDEIKSELSTLMESNAIEVSHFVAGLEEEARRLRDEMLKETSGKVSRWQGIHAPKPFKGKAPMVKYLTEDNQIMVKPLVRKTSAHLKIADYKEPHYYPLPSQPPPPSNGQPGTPEDPFTAMAEEIFMRGQSSKNPLGFSPYKMADTSFHDFAFYEYMMPMEDPYTEGLILSDIEEQGVIEFQQFCEEAYTILLYLTYGSIGLDTLKLLAENPKYDDLNLDEIYESENWWKSFADIIYDNFLFPKAEELYAFYHSLKDEIKSEFLPVYFKYRVGGYITTYYSPSEIGILYQNSWDIITQMLASDISRDYEMPYDFSSQKREKAYYNFLPFPAPSINFGLRILYRQYWQNQGTQDGEIVKTIPLGPKQTEKVSTKMVRRSLDKRSREATVGKDIETETTESTKDSQDIVEEAAESSNWHAEASASYSGFGFSGSVTAGGGGESSSSSKDAKSRLNETMEKTANKIRSETKAVVSTEREATYEEERSSEITNPNEELAITYVYKKLMKQYRITTKMAEVNSVVFVGEPVPDPAEIDADWIRQHDDIIIKVLLDPSLADDLNVLRNEINETEIEDSIEKNKNIGDTNDPEDFFKALASEAKNKLGEYKASSGTFPDIFKTPQESFIGELGHQRELQRRAQQSKIRLERIRKHIIDNILHYMRAIWMAEDPDARQLRFMQRMVPTKWNITDVDNDGNAEFTPVDDDPAYAVPLSEVIHPAGLLGFAGNYAVYLMKSNPDLVNLNEALSVLRQGYSTRKITITADAANSGNCTLSDFRMEDERNILYTLFTFIIEVKTLEDGSKRIDLIVTNKYIQEKKRIVDANSVIGKNYKINAWGGIYFKLDKDSPLDMDSDVGDSWTVHVGPGELRDPELIQIIAENPLPETPDEPTVYSVEMLAEMAEFFPQITRKLKWDEETNEPKPWDAQNSPLRELVRNHYHEYLLHKKYTQTILVDTNNLMVDLELGATSALEEFKRLHRYVDVMKAHLEKEKLEVEKAKLEVEIAKLQLENERRQKLIEVGKFGDPDIEKVTVIGKETELQDIVNVEMAEDNTDN